ncbi:YceI-like domain protein [Planctomycetes bacterium Pla163]|uniref:YceI-like domain protein n=1 Tax=Rohdeia mirabilis TaxID=2528008 RepID=A0A518CVL1_9BACT|nr:YceI-like domain protein [Planctomycetes bacterium Pla163]
MKRILPWIGALALVAWTGAGAAAWMLTKDHVTVVLTEGESSRTVADDPVALMRDDVASLQADVAALAKALEGNLGVLDQRDDERAAQLRRELADVRTELARLQGAGEGALVAEIGALRRELTSTSARATVRRAGAGEGETGSEAPPVATDPSDAVAVSSGLSPASEEEVVVEAVEVAVEEVAPAPRASFLAFSLPSDDFRFDERRSWTVVPNLSRVGFDGVSTLHDFTGTTSAIAGTMDFDLAHPADEPHGHIEVESRSLRTGSDGRDSEMFDVIAVDDYEQFVFELTAFEPESVDVDGRTVHGTARGTMTIRGVSQDLAFPVTAAVDASRRLSLDGETTLHLPDFGVPVPNKLGLITMEDDIRLWIAVRARLEPRTEAKGGRS